MAWTTVRCWLMRLGLYALLRPLKQADDWAYLIDHTVQIGEVKCFAVVGVQLSQLPYPHRCLQREDLELIAPVPMVHSTAVTVEQALEEACAAHGNPSAHRFGPGGRCAGRHRAILSQSSARDCHLRHGPQGSEPPASVAGSR